MRRLRCMANAISVEKLTVHLGGRPVLSNISLTIPNTTKVALTGPSGCGKSTLMRSLLGFVPRHSGRILWNEQPLKGKDFFEFRKQTGYISQELQETGGKVLEWTRALSQFGNSPNDDFDTLLDANLRLLDLPSSTLDQDLGGLSRGERQRLCLAALMARRPSFYLLDEATSALENTLKERVAAHFARLEDVTVIVISHDAVWEHTKAFDQVRVGS